MLAHNTPYRWYRATPLKAVALLCLPLVVGRSGLAAPKPQAPAQEPTAVERQVVQASSEWFEALTSGNVETLDRLETEDFYMVQQGPSQIALVGKARQLEELRKSTKPRPRLERTLEAIKVREYGNVAILTAVASIRQTESRQNATLSKAMIVEVWVTHSGQWRLAHVQATGVPAARGR
jgi:ketosteroid isomerase-like protein